MDSTCTALERLFGGALLKFQRKEVKREALVLGRPADVRKVWQATKSYWRIIGLTYLIEKEGEGEEEEGGWAEIQAILEMEDEEWEALSLIRWW